MIYKYLHVCEIKVRLFICNLKLTKQGIKNQKGKDNRSSKPK